MPSNPMARLERRGVPRGAVRARLKSPSVVCPVSWQSWNHRVEGLVSGVDALFRLQNDDRAATQSTVALKRATMQLKPASRRLKSVMMGAL